MSSVASLREVCVSGNATVGRVARNWQKAKQQPKRVYYFNPHLIYQPRAVHQPEVSDKFFETYPQSAFWPK